VFDPADGPVALSGIALGVAGPSPPALNASALSPVVPFQPATTRTFAATDTLRVFGRVFWRGADPPEVVVGLRSSPASAQRPALSASPGPRGRQQSAFEISLPLVGVSPGADAIEVVGQMPDGRVVTRVVPIRIAVGIRDGS
jgi:hypothetical protein